jgi:hypothetical protein
MACCEVRVLIVGNRGGKLAAEHLAKQFGHPVRNHGLKISLRWWHEYVDGEGTTLRDARWQRHD